MTSRWPPGERLSAAQANIVHLLTVDGPLPLRHLHKASVRSLESRGIVRLIRRRDTVIVELHPARPVTISR